MMEDEPIPDDSPDLCEFCGEPEEVIIEDIGCCRKCEPEARVLVWNRRYR